MSYKLTWKLINNIILKHCYIVFKGTGETVSVFVHDVKSSSEDKVIYILYMYEYSDLHAICKKESVLLTRLGLALIIVLFID